MRYVVITVFLFFAVMPVFSRGETFKIESIYPSRAGNLTVEKNVFLATDANSNVGIRTGAPGSKLGIYGGIAVGDSSYSDRAVEPSTAGGAIIQGNVGIGITSPTEKLDVVGNIKTSGKVLMGWEMISNSTTADTTQAKCNGTKKVIGGGCYPIVRGEDLSNLYSYPNESGDGWNCTEEMTNGKKVTAYAICASIDK